MDKRFVQHIKDRTEQKKNTLTTIILIIFHAGRRRIAISTMPGTGMLFLLMYLYIGAQIR
jgi:hypothetical protein